MYRFGNPIETGAVVLEKSAGVGQDDRLLDFMLDKTDKKVVLSRKLAVEDRVFGLGQAVGPLNRRGKRYRSWCQQAIPFVPDRAATNGAHPFLLLKGEQLLGIFVDYPSEIWFDIGFTKANTLEIELPSSDFDLYLIKGRDPADILRKFRELTGKSFVPPKWAFGFQQSRYSYETAQEIRELVTKFREQEIPCDAVYMDIDYMPKYKVFTIDEQRFPEFNQFAKEISSQGIQLVPIIDPGVRVESGYAVYEEGLAQGYFCKKRDGQDFFASVWPGYTHLPNFLDPKCREWWGQLYKVFTDAGITSFWNDMNEPQFWYHRDGFRDIGKKIANVDETEFLGTESIQFKSDLNSFWMNDNDYAAFSQTLPNGEVVNHWHVHNLYGAKMVQAGAEGLQRLVPDNRHFIISRSSYIGSHRDGGVWTGDNDSWWEHLLLNIRQVIGLNMVGFLYAGADIGGHVGNSSAELVIRWHQLGAFTPLFRNHSSIGTRRQEPWEFDEQATRILRDTIRLRYAFSTYAYSEFMQAAAHDAPFVSPLFLAFDDERTLQVEDQFMYGTSLMVAPVIEPSARGRYVHLPQCKWLGWKAQKYETREFDVFNPGDYWIDADLSTIPLFIRENSLLPLVKPRQSLQLRSEDSPEELIILGFIGDKAECCLYEDDGKTLGYVRGEYSYTLIKLVKRADGKVEASIETKCFGSFSPDEKVFRFEVYDLDGKKLEVNR